MANRPLETLQNISVERARERMYHGGIVRHSIKKTYFIFCVGNDMEKIKAFTAWALENNLGFKSLKGSYYGNPEHSFIANMKDYERILPFLDAQESILVLDKYDARDRPRATLRIITTGETIGMGRLIPIDEAEVPKFDAWTFDPMDGQYYTCKR